MRDTAAEAFSDAARYRERDLRIFLATRFLSTIAMMVQSVAVGWQVYDIARDPLSLGLVGLAEFVPMFLLVLPAGDIVDRFDPRQVLAISLAAEGLCGVLLFALSFFHFHILGAFYVVLVLFGAARGFSGPSGQSLLPFLVPPGILPRAIAWSSSSFQVAVIAGPAIGGFLYALGPEAAYALCAAAFLGAGMGVAILGGRRSDPRRKRALSTSERVLEGITFVRRRPIILGAISLDLFAVLLGGATALLPVFARDILHTGPVGLGFLRSASAVGAAGMAFALARRPLTRSAGVKMFSAVAVFGAATIVFALSRNFALTFAALAVLGASDMISVYVRGALIQFATPDPMRGRVSAVNMLFIGASNELGEFESGLTAQWFGTVPAVIFGGIGTLLVVAIWMWLFPPLRNVDRLQDASAQ
ncbi:MAG TPA: MFS transporter [Rhizomicrobium sp.]|nr:MFS transporter [Rhizomicrobium sp.]